MRTYVLHTRATQNLSELGRGTSSRVLTFQNYRKYIDGVLKN